MIAKARIGRATEWTTLRRASAALAVGVAAVVAGAAPADAAWSANTIAPTATVQAHGYVARAHVLIGCTEGQFVLFDLTLAQGSTTATGYGAGRCTGELTAYPVVVVGRGGTLVPGNASACASADNYNLRGEGEASLRWCRAGGVALVSG